MESIAVEFDLSAEIVIALVIVSLSDLQANANVNVYWKFRNYSALDGTANELLGYTLGEGCIRVVNIPMCLKSV